MKKCGKCGEIKNPNEFNKHKSSKAGLGFYCKECQKIISRKRYEENIEKIKAYKKEYYKKNVKRNPSYNVEHYQNRIAKDPDYNKKLYQKRIAKDPDYNTKRYQRAIKRDPAYRKKLYQKMMERNPDYYNNLRANKRRTDPMFKLNIYMGNRIRSALEGNKNGRHWENLLSWTLKELQIELNRQMSELNKKYPEKEPMTLANHGTKWELHHKIYQSYWKFERPEDPEFKQCWALCNLMPIWKDEHKKIHRENLFVWE